ncbi:type I-D CRISPR-associated protein Cas7/Csc2 [Oscillatoria sp. HE19RPO]|uniref:type I-D CRISPR-associated protein Cas7/Csc2 n=1 Tax=Oscillatoria sp. HE19RPO TaxID=2954806 RepID=UPI0020C1E1B5|nr:type I-D CRISPR-associated protein Cas7/Csc2 [Oscillatoria sp. HE19RPO]
MTQLETIQSSFSKHFPRLAGGRYVQFLMLRHSQSFPVFQTDGVLNTARTQAGIKSPEMMSRLVLFKRKQTTPERLTGRELLRSLGITSGEIDAPNYCEYNGEKSCKKCPDCILYGFAIGDSGSERSKVYSDSAFSLSAYEQSHRSFTFNAPFEGGTMSEGGKMRSAINELDHVIPEVTFPTVETLRDSTYEGFLYVLGNLIRTRRYGAQESRTGTVKNHLLGIVISDGEIFSNLHFTQALYDALNGDTTAAIADIKAQATTVIHTLLAEEPVRIYQTLTGEPLKTLLDEVLAIYQNEAALTPIISTLATQTQTYSETYGAESNKKKKR